MIKLSLQNIKAIIGHTGEADIPRDRRPPDAGRMRGSPHGLLGPAHRRETHAIGRTGSTANPLHDPVPTNLPRGGGPGAVPGLRLSESAELM